MPRTVSGVAGQRTMTERSSPAPDERKDHVSVRVDAGHLRTIRAFAVRRGMTVSAAIQLVLFEGLVRMNMAQTEGDES